MTMYKNINTSEDFLNSVHLFGRLSVAVCLVAFIMIPVGMSWIYGSPINYAATFKAAIPILMIFTFAGICENLSYAPMIGPGALYSSCVSGDLSSMKVPAAMNAMKVAKVEPGTEKGDIHSILATSTCAFVTASIALLGMLFLAPIVQPIFSHPAVNPSFANLVPAIYGTLLIPRLLRNPMVGFPVLALPVTMIYVLGRGNFPGNQGFIMLGTAAIAVTYAVLLNRKKLITAHEADSDNIAD
jgi:hypothetical protein